ncbi:hypothetical protein F4604DRAFT_1921847 [Suillus subluteus]|nr:hypothetical protein F4604DRAFT_1921847 [Suillus subluteus]
MYPAHYKSWFATESQESDLQSSCASLILDLDQISYDLDHASWTHNLTLSPIDINARSLDDSINPDTSVLFSPALPSSIHPTGTRSDASTAIIPFSDDSDTLPLEPDISLKSNTPADLMCLFSANLIQRRAGTHWWEIECPDCKAWIKTTLPTRILSNLDAPGYFNTLSDHRQGKKCLKGHSPVDSSPSPSTVSPALSISSHFTPSDMSHTIDACPEFRYIGQFQALRFLKPSPSVELLQAKVSFLLTSTLVETSLVHTLITVQYSAENNQLKLKGLNDARRVLHVLTQLDDYKSLIMALSEHDIPHLQHILTVALKRGSSIWQIINTLEDSLTDAYHPRGYTGDDFDMAVLAYRLGGRALLHAFSHRLALPSLHTLQAHQNFTPITPTVGPIAPDQLDSNINNLLLNLLSDSSLPCRGYSVLMDEITLEERASHHHASNSIIGLCHSHLHLIDPSLHTYNSALRIAEKLAEGTIHLGKEMSVIAVGSFGDDEIFPVLATPTCKCEDNGDSTQRVAGHQLFLKTELSVTFKLYGTLSHMWGLILATGEGKITLDFNYKHIFKRWCTLLRSHKGMKLVNGHTINSAVLARYLSWLPDQDEASILKLLNPDDPQDTPRMIELMQAIIALSKNEFDTAIMSVGKCADIAAIKVLGAILESILLPFIDIMLSLHQQVAHLSHYVHLTFTFFHLYCSTFMPHVLYYNSQMMAKNACFCVAKQQKLDRLQKFWLIQTGDDHLEKLFGITWMRGQQNSAMNYSQALDRIGTTKDINTVFKKHPDLESGS